MAESKHRALRSPALTGSDPSSTYRKKLRNRRQVHTAPAPGQARRRPPGRELLMTTANTNIERAEDVVSFLKSQHEEIKSRFQQVSNATGDARQEAFDGLRRLLAVHETAEEEVVYPRAKKASLRRIHRRRKAFGGERGQEGARRAAQRRQAGRATAPTRPHPGVESAPANMLAGPFASMLDRARDAITGKS